MILFANKRGIVQSLLVVTTLMFIFAVGSLASLYMWNEFETSIQNIDNETIRPEVKDQISLVGEKLFWADDLFVLTYFCLLLAFMISARTIPVDDSVYLIIYFIILIVVCIIAMFMSNTWEYLITGYFSGLSDDLSMTTHFMRYYPLYTLFSGVVAAVLFYTRSKGGGVSGVSAFE